MRRNLFLTLAISSLVAGCAGEIADPTEPATPAREFTSKESFLEWVAGTAAEGGFDDLYVARDEKGVIQGVTFTGAANRDRVIDLLGGMKGSVKIGGESVQASVFKGQPQALEQPAGTGTQLEATSQALTSGVSESLENCSGAFCARSASVNTHISIPKIKLGFHEVGGGINQTAGGWQKRVYSPSSSYGRNCGNGPDRRTDCNYDRGGLVCTCTSCSNGDPLTYGPSGRSSAWMCTHTEGWNQLSAQVTYFGETQRCSGNICPQVPVALGTEWADAQNSPSVGRTRTAYGRFIFPCSWGPPEQCEIKGAVTKTSGFGAGAQWVINHTTAAGRYDTDMTNF